MVLLVAVAVSLLIGFLSGGTLKQMSSLRIRYLPYLFAALAVQMAIFTPILGTRQFIHDTGPYIYIATLLVTLFVMFNNRQIPGMTVIMFGAFLNALVITANGGYMPSPAEALREAGRLDYVQCSDEDKDCIHSNSTVADDDTRLRFFGDVIAMPDSLPLANVISPGDIVIAIGAAIAIVTVMHRRPEEREPTDTETAPSQLGGAPPPTNL
ncbi:MAG: DUF5317 domain-containing protein [Chloroflexota bacterium]|nr:DUF5317 domain-containing protein [Chloroflexota bacterium]